MCCQRKRKIAHLHRMTLSSPLNIIPGSSYWSLKLSWRVFFCAMATLLYTSLIAGSKAVEKANILNPSYIESYAGEDFTMILLMCHW